MTRSLDATYVLPFKRSGSVDVAELTDYLRLLSERLEVIVVDGSDPRLFAEHHVIWGGFVRHVPPDPDLDFLNGKVSGVTTGVRLASSDIVVIADDDVRYDEPALTRIVGSLHDVELVRPQNYFDPLPWHAVWDTARTLLNRSVSSDYPGTLGIRKSFFMKVDGYDGDVLFENLELIRTFEAEGATIISPLDLFVRRLPPTAAGFWAQRVRQAYDEFARPPLLALWLSVIPAVGIALARRRARPVALATVAGVAVAEVGRQRGGGTSVFPVGASFLAPVWILERGVCSWLALWSRVARGGVRYGDNILSRAATPKRILRHRFGRGR